MKDEKLPRLRDTAYMPDRNPLAEEGTIQTKRRYVRAGRAEQMLNTETGEILKVTPLVHQIEYKDDAQFVKIFSDGIKAAFELSKTAARVFQTVLEQYEKEPMNNGYADSIYLAWFNKGLSGEQTGMSEPTFNRGMRELVAKGFIYPRSPSLYWVNPNLFFKGDRVMFVKEYRRSHRIEKHIEQDGNK